jgi:hypothetical protein
MKNHLATGQGPHNDEGVGDIAGHHVQIVLQIAFTICNYY